MRLSSPDPEDVVCVYFVVCEFQRRSIASVAKRLDRIMLKCLRLFKKDLFTKLMVSSLGLGFL